MSKEIRWSVHEICLETKTDYGGTGGRWIDSRRG